MVGKLFHVDIRELFFGLMDSHGVIETAKVLILNARDSGVANKVMLGNMLDPHGGGIACQLVLCTVDGIGFE